MNHSSARDGENRPTAASFLAGELDEREVEELLTQAEADEEASRELDLVADLAAITTQPREVVLGQPPGRRSRQVALFVALAAAAVVLLLLGPFGGGAKIEGLAPPTFLPSALRSETGTLAAMFHDAMIPYSRGAHAQSVAALDAFLLTQPKHGPATFYRAVSLEAIGRHDEASEGYRALAFSRTDKLAGHASWRLAHLFLATGDEHRARAILEALHLSGGEFAPNAAALLARIDAR